MKLDCTVCDIEVLTKKVIQGKKVNADGSVNTYYILGVSNGEELGEVGCTLSVYNKVNVRKIYDFHFAFETKYDKVFVKFDDCAECSDTKK